MEVHLTLMVEGAVMEGLKEATTVGEVVGEEA